MSDTPTRKTDKEIWARIAALTEHEKLFDRSVPGDARLSALAIARIDELQWVLGE